MKIVHENRHGLFCEFVLQCEMCLCFETITTEDRNKQSEKLNINSSLVLGAISTGIGHSQINELAAAIDMPMMSSNTFSDYHEKVADIIRDSARSTMESAAAEEASIALQAKEVDEHGVPCITVVTDGAWAKRSYNVNYDSSSGVVSFF